MLGVCDWPSQLLNETLKWLSSLPIIHGLMSHSGGESTVVTVWFSLFPTHLPDTAFVPFLISLMVSVDIKGQVQGLG